MLVVDRFRTGSAPCPLPRSVDGEDDPHQGAEQARFEFEPTYDVVLTADATKYRWRGRHYFLENLKNILTNDKFPRCLLPRGVSYDA
jgi:hypothetical protein